jgi:hypothetical protein
VENKSPKVFSTLTLKKIILLLFIISPSVILRTHTYRVTKINNTLMSSEQTIDELVHELEALQIREANIIKQIKKIREKQQREVGVGTTAQVLTTGCRIRVLNKPTKPSLTAPASPRDKVGTVTSITTARVYFTTDNGVNTYRAHKNVQVVPP